MIKDHWWRRDGPGQDEHTSASPRKYWEDRGLHMLVSFRLRMSPVASFEKTESSKLSSMYNSAETIVEGFGCRG